MLKVILVLCVSLMQWEIFFWNNSSMGLNKKCASCIASKLHKNVFGYQKISNELKIFRTWWVV